MQERNLKLMPYKNKQTKYYIYLAVKRDKKWEGREGFMHVSRKE